MDPERWKQIASALSVHSLGGLHHGLSCVFESDPEVFETWAEFREQTDIIEAELTKRGWRFAPVGQLPRH